MSLSKMKTKTLNECLENNEISDHSYSESKTPAPIKNYDIAAQKPYEKYLMLMKYPNSSFFVEISCKVGLWGFRITLIYGGNF